MNDAKIMSFGNPSVGIKFNTSFTNRIEITRDSGMNVYITPANPEEFVRQLQIRMNHI